jgi:hypothetical protein
MSWYSEVLLWQIIASLTVDVWVVSSLLGQVPQLNKAGRGILVETSIFVESCQIGVKQRKGRFYSDNDVMPLV